MGTVGTRLSPKCSKQGAVAFVWPGPVGAQVRAPRGTLGVWAADSPATLGWKGEPRAAPTKRSLWAKVCRVQGAIRGRAPTLLSSPAGSSSPRSTGRASTRWCLRVCWASYAAPGGRRARSGCAGAAARNGRSASWCPRAPAPPRAAPTSLPSARPPLCSAAAPAPGARAGIQLTTP